MGNFSRDTFVPARNYVAMRVQQGVPLLDSDLNELHDIARHELYDALRIALPDGVRPSSPDDPQRDFRISTNVGPNDFELLAGSALIAGRPVQVRAPIRYSTQPWTEPARAVADSVPVIPPLTTPSAGRRDDLVYLDVWEREVGRAEDVNLVNPAVGVETSVRLKREAAVRVLEGDTVLPGPPPSGHAYLPMALLNRVGPSILPNEIREIKRPLSTTGGYHPVSLVAAFQPLPDLGAAWTITDGGFARKPSGAGLVAGMLPVTLPHGARVTAIRIGINIYLGTASVKLRLFRLGGNLGGDSADLVTIDELLDSGAGESNYIWVRPPSTQNRVHVVDNDRHAYAVIAQCSGIAQVQIYPLQIRCML
jgi:hypothetical protein